MKDNNESCRSCTGCYGCYGCYGCTGCTGCYGCTGCTGCYGCTGCDGCYGCTGCTGCYGCTGCTGCDGCYGCTGCRALYRSLFCKGIEGAKYMLFNTQVTQARYEEVRDGLYRAWSDWRPYQTNAFDLKKTAGSWEKIDLSKLTVKSWKESWADMPKAALDYLAALPEFDAALFKEITGLDAGQSLTGKRVRVKLTGGQIIEGEII